MAAAARALCALHFDQRPAGATVNDEVGGAGARYITTAAWAIASLPAGAASADGEQRRHITRSSERDGARGKGAWRGWRRRAECTCLSAASYCASFPWYSARCFGVHLHARSCAASVGCAAQHSVTRHNPGRPRRRRAAAARRSHPTRHCAACHCTRQSAVASPCMEAAGIRPPHSRRSLQAETAHP
jgi:hypothetical protein